MIKYNLKTILLLLIAIFLLTGCTENKIDVLAYPTKIKTKITIPEVCMLQYKSAMPTVAVMEFTNNSTFGKAKTNQTNSTSVTNKKAAAVAGIVSSPNAVGVGFIAGSNTKNKSKVTNVQREIDAKLSASITGPLESIIVNSGGAKLFSRADMDKIDTELKFQDSGLLDPTSAVQFGKMSGVRFIITGSIDNVEQNYQDNLLAAGTVATATSYSDNDNVKIIGALLTLGASVTDGMLIKTKMTIKMLDVQTGEIVFTKQLEEKTNIGKIKEPSYDQVIGAVKATMLNALPLLEKDLSIYLAVKGYITQLKTKGDDIIAQVNIGRDLKVEENQFFKVYVFDQLEDPMTGEVTCDVIQTRISLRASHQITSKTTWATVEEGDASMLKLGQLVQKSNKKASFVIPSF
jgi:hypothetical protein